MPSGHAPLCATVATVLVLLAWECTEWFRRSVVLAGAVCVVTCMVISRTSLGHACGLRPLGRPNPRGCHSQAQAWAGVAVGTGVGALAWRGLRR